MHRGLWLGPRLLTPGRVATAGAAAAAAAAVHNRDRLQDLRLNLHTTVIEGVSGAAGEVAQIALVYPLDTVKVRAQAWGWSSRKVIADLMSSTGGSPTALLAALYAGAVPAAMLSVLVGSVHYISFCTTRRALIKLESMGGPRSSSSSSSSSSRSGGQPQQAAADGEPQQHMIVSHGVTGTHFLLDEEQQLQNTSSSSRDHSSGRDHSSSSHGAEGSMRVNILSAVITAAITALVEAPLELFRHNCQAGQIQGSFVRAMWRTLRRSGPRSLYLGFLPYCLESWPYDITELLVVGAGRDARHLAPGLAPAAYDMALGGLAGALAVAISQPFDTVKTYIQVTPGNELNFYRAGQQLVARGGPGALFVGLAPRLAHQVPGAMVCWLVIESCQRWLLQAAARAEQDAGDSAAAPGAKCQQHQQQ